MQWNQLEISVSCGILKVKEMFLQDMDDGSRQLVFIDEMPWLDTPKSGFITAFEGFWNTWACSRKKCNACSLRKCNIMDDR